MKGYVNCVRMLLEADADIRLDDELGFTVFQKAERSKRREPVLRLLRSRGKAHHYNNINYFKFKFPFLIQKGWLFFMLTICLFGL